MSGNNLVHEWLKYSQNDLISAKHLYDDLHPKQTEVACYLSQQCAEKALKGYILFMDIEPPKTHNLVELLELCKEMDRTISVLLPQLDVLTDYAVLPRYPNALGITDIDMITAIKYAKAVQEFILKSIAMAM